MRNVIVQEFVTVNGLAAGPNDSVDFVPASTSRDPSFGRRQLRFIDSIDTILLGRKTYEMFAGYWPNVTSGEDREFANKINATPRVVFSNSLDRAPWGKFEPARIAKNAAEEVKKLKRASGKDMVIWGSLSLAGSLLKDGLIDEVQLIVCPVVLGGGRPLLPEQLDSLEMKLLKTQSFDSGTVLLAYRTANAAGREQRRS